MDTYPWFCAVAQFNEPPSIRAPSPHPTNGTSPGCKVILLGHDLPEHMEGKRPYFAGCQARAGPLKP